MSLHRVRASLLPPVGQLLTLLALALALSAPSPARAASAPAPNKIFVASYGSDANAGTTVAPKRNFQAAHDAVAPGGDIIVLDTAGYGPVTITKSVAITCPPGVTGFITVTGAVSAIYVNAAATDTVVLRGLVIEGSGPGAGSAIYSTKVNALRVEDCKIRNIDNGIYVVNPVFSAHLTVDHCEIGEVKYGVSFDGSAVGLSGFTVVRSTIADSAYGIVCTGSGTHGSVRECAITNSSASALLVPNYGVIYAGTNTFSGNFRTHSADAGDTGVIFGYGDNLINDYGGNPGFSTTKGTYY